MFWKSIMILNLNMPSFIFSNSSYTSNEINLLIARLKKLKNTGSSSPNFTLFKKY